MEFSEEIVIICRLCLNKFTKNCTPIGEVIQPTLNFLILHPNLTISDNPMMCETCGGNLTKCFDFKTRCLSTEDYISSFAEGGVKKVDLRDIYLKVKQDGNINRVPDDHSVCRFCLKLVKHDAFMSVRDDLDLIEILRTYFVEMDLKIIDDIVACTPCYDSLQVYGTFVNNYTNIEERIEEYCKVEGLNHKDQVDLRDVATFVSKSLLNVEDMSSLIIKEEKLEDIVETNVDVKVKFEDLMEVKQEEKLIVNEVQEENSNSCQHPSPSQSDTEQQLIRVKSAMYICEICGYQNNRRYRVKEHILTHKGTDRVASYNCEICPFKTIKKEYLRKHLLRHEPKNTDVPVVTPGTMHKCDLCDYEARETSRMKRHMLSHKSFAEITMHKCERCNYETRYKGNLQQHMLVHMEWTEIEMHKCDLCPFQTKWKRKLRGHLLSHRNAPDVETGVTMYKCDLCDYKAKQMYILKRHVRSHKTPSKITLYKCDSCDYETKIKPTLMRHMLIHKSPSEITMYKCDKCDYEGKRKCDLRRHVLIHRTPSETTMYKCEKCAYEAKHKSYLKNHMQIHMDVPEFKTKKNTKLQRRMLSHRKNLDTATHKAVYECDLCDHETTDMSNLRRHMLTHQPPSEITMYKCATCTFETRYKNCLQQHVLIHMDPSKIEMRKCEFCPFETKWPGALRKHLFSHRGTPDVATPVNMFKCDLCDYKAEQECDLKGHFLIHKTHLETTVDIYDLKDEVKVQPEDSHTDS